LDSIQDLEEIQIYQNESLSSVNLPNLKMLGGDLNSAEFTHNLLLDNLNLSGLEFVARRLKINQNALTSLNLSSLNYARQVQIGGESSLTTIDLTSLTECLILNISYNPYLSILNLPSLDFTELGAFYLNRNGFNSSAINGFLSELVAANVTDINIQLQDQNPPAPPTGQGLIDKQTLIDNGNTVLTD
jgi:hypothetical protein